MGSIVPHKKIDKATGKEVTLYRAFIRRQVGDKIVSKSKILSTKTQAKEWLRLNEDNASLSAMAKATGPLFSVVVDNFTKAPPIRGTKFWMPSHLDFWLAEFGTSRIDEISKVDINLARGKLQVKKAKHNSPSIVGSTESSVTETGKAVTPATVNRYLATLSSIFNYAADQGLVEFNPLKAGGVRKLKESKGRRRVLTDEEQQRIIAAADESRWPLMGLFVRMALTTAARRGELLKLRWKDIHLDDCVAILPTSKNEEQRALPLVRDIRARLVEAMKVRTIKSDLVFYDPKHPTKAKNIQETWRQVRIRAGLYQDRDDPLDRVVMHSARHTACTEMVKSGANLMQVSAVTGHKTLSMLKRYSHMDIKGAVALAEQTLGKKVAQ